MTKETQDRKRERRSPAIGHAFAALSLLCCASPWLVGAYGLWKGIRRKDQEVLPWIVIIPLALIFAILAVRLRSKLSWIALTVSIFMMILMIYAGGL